MNIALSALEVLIGIAVLIATIVGLIVAMRVVYGKQNRLLCQNKNDRTRLRYKHRTKYPEVNVFDQRGMLFRLGLASSIVLSILVISWTSYDDIMEYPTYVISDESLIEVDPPRTDMSEPLPLPPAQPIIEEVPIDEIIEEQADFEPTDVEDDFVYEEPVLSSPKHDIVKALPLPSTEDDEIIEIFKIVEEMPLFPGCNHVDGTQQEKRACSDKKLLAYLYKSLKYPSIARENGLEGKVYVQFVVEKDGSISDSQILRDIGGGCGQAVLKVVQNMNNLPIKWTPGKQRGSVVRVMYTLPVTFRLEN